MAKFDEEADFEVRSAVAHQKQHQINEKRNFRSDRRQNSASKNETSGIVWNTFWESFAPIRAMFEDFSTSVPTTPVP